MGRDTLNSHCNFNAWGKEEWEAKGGNGLPLKDCRELQPRVTAHILLAGLLRLVLCGLACSCNATVLSRACLD